MNTQFLLLCRIFTQWPYFFIDDTIRFPDSDFQIPLMKKIHQVPYQIHRILPILRKGGGIPMTKRKIEKVKEKSYPLYRFTEKYIRQKTS